MPKIKYQDFNFRAGTLAIIKQANEIIADYTAQGFQLTLRQLYYQFVARDFIRNKQTEYDRLGSIINDARLAGLIDWNAIEDRTRNVRSIGHWKNPAEIIEAVAQQFSMDLWRTQRHRVEVWIEKDALVGVIEDACNEWDTPFFSCRGYVSQSEMWGAAMRAVSRFSKERKRTIVLHFGDHDPSGIDMTRDIGDRVNMFCAHHGARGAFEIRRLALNMDQVEQYNPPPNPAKSSDSRFAAYYAEHGDESWELDALEPRVINALVVEEIKELLDMDAFDECREEQDEHRRQLQRVSDQWDDVIDRLD